MAVASTRQIIITSIGDSLNNNVTTPIASNAVAPGDTDVFSLTTGFNSIPFPTGGTTVKGATIIPPPANAQTITLKGITGDTGIPLHKTEPTSIALENPSAFGLTVGGNIDGLRVVWT